MKLCVGYPLAGLGQVDRERGCQLVQGLYSGLKVNDGSVQVKGGDVFVKNGLKDTETTNGCGNVIIGYNEPGGFNDRSGSHMLVVGNKLNYTSYGGIVAGQENAAFGAFSSVSGGTLNVASGEFSTVTAGDANVATLIICFILFNPFDWSFLNTSGPVRGFALTLALGVILSLFTGVVVTRTILRSFYRGN